MKKRLMSDALQKAWKQGPLPGTPLTLYAVYLGQSINSGTYLGNVPAHNARDACDLADKNFTIPVGADITVVAIGTEIARHPITKQ